MSALSKYTESLENYPTRGSGLHQHVMSCACLGVIAEIPPPLIIQDMESAFDGLKHNETTDAVKKASGMEFSKHEYAQPPKKTTKKHKSLDDFINYRTAEEVELWEMSPYRLMLEPSKDGKILLETLYSPDDVLFIGDVFDRKVFTVSEWLEQDITEHPHIIPNPMTGKEGLTASAKLSSRCENTVADARFAVCEMDTVPIEKQTAFWIECINLGIPVAAVIHSGRKSLHGWVQVDCKNDIKKWDELVRGWWFKDFGVCYGLDSACQNRARLSRLPGHQRESGGMQKLLYLNGVL